MQQMFLFIAVLLAGSASALAQGATQYHERGAQGCSAGQALIGVHVDREIHLCVDIVGAPIFIEAETDNVRQSMLACGAGSYALRYHDTSEGYASNELLCALGPIARTDWEGNNGSSGSVYQYALSGGGTAHGCPYLVSPDGSMLIVQVVTGVHRGRNELLCAPLQPFVAADLLQVPR